MNAGLGCTTVVKMHFVPTWWVFSSVPAARDMWEMELSATWHGLIHVVRVEKKKKI